MQHSSLRMSDMEVCSTRSRRGQHSRVLACGRLDHQMGTEGYSEERIGSFLEYATTLLSRTGPRMVPERGSVALSL